MLQVPRVLIYSSRGVVHIVVGGGGPNVAVK